MRSLLLPLALALLLGTAGCVSVPPAATPGPNRPAPAGDPAPAPVVRRPPAEPPAREELATTGPLPTPRTDPVRRGGAARGERPTADRRVTVEPPRGQAVRRPAAEGRTGSKRPVRPRPGPPAARPRPTYGMADLCKASRGVTDPSVTALCRDSFVR